MTLLNSDTCTYAYHYFHVLFNANYSLQYIIYYNGLMLVYDVY